MNEHERWLSEDEWDLYTSEVFMETVTEKRVLESLAECRRLLWRVEDGVPSDTILGTDWHKETKAQLTGLPRTVVEVKDGDD